MDTRTSIRIALILAGLLALFALLALGASAVYMDFQDADAPDWVYDDENITVTYSIYSDEYTWDQIEYTGLTWGERYLGEFYNHSQSSLDFVLTEDITEDLTFSLSFEAPDGPIAELDIHMFAHVTGVWGDYNEYAGAVEVKTLPVVQFAGTLGWDLVGRDHEVMASVLNADPSEIEEVSVYWDTVSHLDEGQDKTLYPNRTAVITHQLLTPYYFNITLPDEQSIVYILVHSLINGRDFYDSSERSIAVYPEPEFEVTAPAAAFKGTNVVINWSIPTTGGTYIESTSVYWDTVSHASAMEVGNYASRSDVLAGDDSRSYEVTITVPDEAGTVYFIAHCSLKLYGYEFTTETEHTIDVIEEPVVTVNVYPEEAFVGADVQFVWTVSAPAGAVEETAIHWDTTSHAGALDVASYPHASVWMIGEDDMTYDVTFEMPESAGTLYFIAHAKVLGEDFYVPAELSITIRDMPTVSITSYPEEANVGGIATIDWEVTGALETDTFGTFVHWDTASHVDEPLPSNYAEHSESIGFDLAGVYSFQLTLPDTAGTVYLIVSADVEGMTFVDPNEVSITVKALPSVVNVTAPDKTVDGGKKATITFSLEDVGDPDKVEVLWDTVSHDNETGYANTAPATDNGDGTWTVDIKTPEKSVDVFYRVHVEDDGNHGFSPEGSFKVKEVADDSPGFSMLLGVVAISLIAVYVATDHRR
jgi:hypothetical protein